MHREVDEALPSIVVVDPLSSFTGGSASEVSSMVMRLIDYLKGKNVTTVFTHLIPGSGQSDDIELGVSSVIDTWVLLRNAPAGERGGRHVSILKSRGMPHSSERRSFELTDRGARPLPALRSSPVRSGGRA
jgi:circadian clock protein KaiC